MNRPTRPCSTRLVQRDGTHSSSIGRETGRPGVSGSSTIDRRSSNIFSPTLPASGELPWRTVLPESACSSGRTTAARAGEDAGQGAGGGRPYLRRRREPRLDGPYQRLEVGVARHVGAHVLIVNHQDVVAGDARDFGRHGDADRKSTRLNSSH